jgi:restriction system protein
MEKPPSLTPREYELAVKEILDGAGVELTEFRSEHLEEVAGVDGYYIIDITARFNALGASFLVLVECKHERRKAERQDVQILRDKLRSTGAQKGMLFSVAGFQQGAIEYADVHGIALVQLADGKSTWFTKSMGPPISPPPWVNIPKYVGWWCHGNSMSVMSPDMGEYTRKALGFEE